MILSRSENLPESVTAQLLETARILEVFAEEGMETVSQAARLIADSMKKGGKLLLCGNGGSAADCQHLAAEFVCRLSAQRERRALPALALTTDTSFLTAFCNDYCFDDVFARQVEALGRPGDSLLAISTSGASENVRRALRLANEMGLDTIALTRRGGAVGGMSKISIEVDAEETAIIQNVHIALEHVLCALVEEMLLDGNQRLGGM